MLYRTLAHVLMAWNLYYQGSAFVLLTAAPALRLWRSLYFAGHVMVFGGLLISHVLLVLLPRGRKDKPE